MNASDRVRNRFDVVIVGGGFAGISVAARLRRRRPGLSIAVVEPSDRHYYQPAWTLVAVEGPARKAWFETTRDGQVQREQISFDLLHVVPPQSAPTFIRASALADAAGWVAVDKETLQHVRHENIFSLGDVCSAPTSKTAAAVKSQIPVVTGNLLRVLEGKGELARYDGYASCPLVTSRGKVMLAEFRYGGEVTPSFPLEPRVPRRLYWWLKKFFLPHLYWDWLTRGRGFPQTHKPRRFDAALRSITP